MNSVHWRAHLGAASVALLLLSSLARAEGPPPSLDEGACGLEPPGVQYLPPPGPRPHETRRLSASEPPVVRREERGGAVRALSGVPQTRVRSGALSGKVVYLSPGHGFYRSAPLSRWATQRPNTWAVVEDLISAEVLNQYLLPMLMGAGATVVPVREPDLNARLALVDAGDTGYAESGDAALFEASAQKGWGAPPVPMGNAVEPFTLGTTRVMQTARTATASATWAPEIPADGAYHVYVSYAASPERAQDAHYVVRHAGGESHFRVNQRRHGGTWVLLGRFYFKAGRSPAGAAVVAMNDTAEGGTVALDAVRFGGGRGLMGDAAVGPLPRPRYEEAARYHVQYSGAPVTVYAPTGANALANERNADVTARPRFAAWLHEEGEDAVYVAWHTNASTTGNVAGTEAYVYGPNAVDGTLNFTGVAGSDVLARALLDELGRDIRREVDPNWRVRNLRSGNLGELNPAHNPEMPSVLLEVAYHDNVTDSNRLKEPAFRRVAARAILQGLIKYYAAKDGVPVRLPPEAPAAVVARSGADGQVEVRWAAPGANPDEAGHDAPTGYRVYQSADGLGWDEGTEVADTTFTLTLAAGTARYFRVAAVSAGGEGFPSAIVGVRTPSGGLGTPVLLVNAFERLDSALSCAEALDAYDLEAPVRLLVEAMNDGTYVRRHGDALTHAEVAFDSATSAALPAGLVSLGAPYRLVDWFTGRGGAAGARPTRAEQDALRAFVTGGGHLLLSGSQVTSALAVGADADRAFLADVLRATPGSGPPSLTVEGSAGGWLSDLSGVALDDGTLGAFPVGVTDVLTPASGGSAVLRYAGTDRTAGVVSAPGGQVLLLGVPFEGIVSPALRARLLGSFLVQAGLLARTPAPPVDSGGPGPGLLSGCVAARGVDPHPPAPPPPPPPPPPPEPYVVRVLPQFYPLGESGCGCGAGVGTGSGIWLLLGVIVQLRRARRKAAYGKR